MTAMIDVMLKYFSDSKLAGSYFLLFLVSMVLLYYINKEKNIWFILYGIVLLVVVVMNPVVVWVLSQMFPVLSTYGPVTLLIPVLMYIPLAATALSDSLKVRRVRHLVVVIFVFLIFVCGNMCGLVKDYSVAENNVTTIDDVAVVEYINSKNPTMVLASERIIPAISARGDMIPLFYGRDLWMPNLDTGIMDGYNEEAYTLFDAMKNAKENAKFIAETAYEYSCDIIVMDYFDKAPIILGDYKLCEKTDNYLVYILQ